MPEFGRYKYCFFEGHITDKAFTSKLAPGNKRFVFQRGLFIICSLTFYKLFVHTTTVLQYNSTKVLQHYSFTVLHYYTTTVILYYSTTLLQYTGVNNLNGNWITATAKTKAPNFIQKNVLVYQTTGVKNFASMYFG